MKLVTAVIKPHVLDDVKGALDAFGVRGMTITEAAGHGRQRGKTEVYRGTEYVVDVLPKTRIELVCEDRDAEDVARVIATAARRLSWVTCAIFLPPIKILPPSTS